MTSRCANAGCETTAEALRSGTAPVRVRERAGREGPAAPVNALLSSVVHKLKTPLAAMASAVQVTAMTRDEAARARAQQILKNQIWQLSRLLDDLQVYSSVTNGEARLYLTPLDAALVVKSAILANQASIDESGHALELELPAEPAEVRADFQRLVQVVSILLENAIRFTNDGGRIVIAVAGAGEEVSIRVRDDGIAIPAPLLPRFFDLTAAPSAQPRGGGQIALSLARSLVELFGGTIVARSPGEGVEFEVRLPRLERAPGRPG